MTQNTSTSSKLTQRDLIKARFAHIRWWLDSALTRISPELMEWAPSEGMRTIAGQLVEIISVEVPLVPRLKEGRQPEDSEVDDLIGDQHSLENLRRKLAEVRQGTLDYLDSLTEEELSEEVVSGPAWFGTLWLPAMPRAQYFLNIAEHEFYHVGQLYSYLWCKGDDPYNW